MAVASARDVVPGETNSLVAGRRPWNAVERLSFRFAFVFLLLLVVVIFAPFYLFPVVGGRLQAAVDWCFAGPTVWLGQHVFHLRGVAAHPHATDSRDEALDWIRAGLIVVVSLLTALVWSVLDRRRKEYAAAAAWLRFLLRLSLVFVMLRYGLFKVFPLQMSPPSLAVLNEPMGESSPMTLLWTLIGLHPGYQMLCGAMEVGAAMLLFFRRTALLGALLNAVVMTNVLLFNLFFDVPVKLGAGVILLLTLAVIAPDGRALVSFFWRNKGMAPTGVWVPPAERRRLQVGTRVVEWAFLGLALFYFLPASYRAAADEREALRHPSPLTGAWRVDPAVLGKDGQDLPVLTAEGLPMTALYLEPNGRAMARSSDGRLWRAQAEIDGRAKTLALSSGYFEGTRFEGSYAVSQPDVEHLVLTPTGEDAATHGVLRLTRVPLPARYPLLERQFHWVNEWALER